MGVIFSIWSNIVITQVGGKINFHFFYATQGMVGKRKYMTHSIITKLFSVLMKRFCFLNFGGPFLLSTTDSSPDENGLIFPDFTQLGSGKIAMDYRLRKTYF